MAILDDLLGEAGALKQLFLWNVLGQAVSALMSPAFNALQQDTLEAHPNMVLTPDILARAVVSTFMDKATAISEAARSGTNSERFDILLELNTVRITPADLAEAVLRSYLDKGEAERQAQLQGVTPERFATMTLLAGDGIGPQQAAEAARRGIIPMDGRGPQSVSYLQAIAESRLHDKWAPALYELTRALLSPPDAASAVVRGFLSMDQGAALAALSGVDASQFSTMVELAGDAPSPTALSEALRRQIIPLGPGAPDGVSFADGIREGRLADKWTDMIRQLAQEWPTPVDALEARLVGQVDDAESQALYAKFGGDPQFWDLLFRTRGESPTPLELITMANRGYIPWDGTGQTVTSYDQGFKEGRWRDKWSAVYQKFAQYVPPEGTLTTFLAHGVITDDQAADGYAKLGMTPDVIKWFLDEAHTEALSDYRGATVNQILTAYYEQLITQDQARPILQAMHVTDTAIEFLFLYEDSQRAFTAVNNAVTRTRTLYAARKITEQGAINALNDIGIEPAQINGIIRSWQVENSITVKPLTEAQIADAYELQIMDQPTAIGELTNLGYTPYDAWVLLSIKAKQPLPDAPAQGPPPLQGQVTPGTT